MWSAMGISPYLVASGMVGADGHVPLGDETELRRDLAKNPKYCCLQELTGD